MLTAIATQGYGEPTVAEWVTSFMLLYKREHGLTDYFRNTEHQIQVSEIVLNDTRIY